MTSSQSAVATGSTSVVTTGQFGETTSAEVRKPLRPVSTTLLLRVFTSGEAAADSPGRAKPEDAAVAGSQGSIRPPAAKWADPLPIISMLADAVTGSGGSLSGEEDGLLLATMPGAVEAVQVASRIQLLAAGFARYAGESVAGVAVGISAAGIPVVRKKGADSAGRAAFRSRALPGKVLVLGTIRRQLEDIPGISLRKIEEAGPARAGAVPGAEIMEIVLPAVDAQAASFLPAGANAAVAALPAFEIAAAVPGSGEAIAQPNDSIAGGMFARRGGAEDDPGDGSGFLQGLARRLPTPLRSNSKWIALGAVSILILAVVLVLVPGRSKPKLADNGGSAKVKVSQTPVTQTPGGQAQTGQTPAGASSAGGSTSSGQTPGPAADSNSGKDTKQSAQEARQKTAEIAKNKKKELEIAEANKNQNKQPPPPPTEQAGGDAPVHGGDSFYSAEDLNKLLDKADRDSDNGKYQEAIRTYDTVLKHDRGNRRAQAGREKAVTNMNLLHR